MVDMNALEGVAIGTVSACWRYPVKSFQGRPVDALEVDPTGIDLDRAFGVVDVTTGRLLAAKRVPQLLLAVGDDTSITLPDGTTFDHGDPEVHGALSRWLGREVRLCSPAEAGAVAYEMTFDPPNEDADVFEIPVPEGTLLDLTPVHLVTTATLDACAAARPDLDWDVRRFRPNLVIDADVAPWEEQTWVGQRLAIGTTVLAVSGPMVRCAMPLRPQPGGLDREPGIFRALSELNPAFPNHLGLCLDVVEPGRIEVGDDVALVG
jgi:uncharacterized protein YcbX